MSHEWIFIGISYGCALCVILYSVSRTIMRYRRATHRLKHQTHLDMSHKSTPSSE